MFQKYPFDCSRIPRNPVTNPIGFSGDELLDLFYNVRNFSCSTNKVELYEDPLTIFMRNGGTMGSLASALNALGAVEASMSAKNNSSGVSKRSIKNSSTAISKYPSVCGDYPIHVFYVGLSVITMDLGFVAQEGGLYYPTFSISSSDGTLFGNGSGGIKFGTYGSLMLSNASGAIINGAISENERFDSLEMSKVSCMAGDSITVSTIRGKQFSGFTGVTSIYMGDAKISDFNVGKNGSSIQFSVPEGATTNYVTFETKTDKFQSPVQLVVG